jgi:DNA end-binding protein Ku
MAARAIASGTISFGLVTIPVKLYSTGEAAAGIHFNMVHRECGTPVKQRYYCPTDDRLVEKDEIAKGYEYAKGQYVLFNDDELKALNPEPTNAVEITEFVPAEQVDPVYYDKAYYIGPDKAGARPYRLLAKAMRETGRAALARYAARGKNYLVLVRPFGEDGLVLQQLRYADEVRAFSEVPLGEGDVKPAELTLALQLIEQISSDQFKPESYRDEVREQTRALIDQKIAGQEITAPPQEAPKAQIIDLMEALKASLGSEGGRKPARRAEAAAAKTARAPKKAAARARKRA